jgi:uncharacterized cupin superfamily protein
VSVLHAGDVDPVDLDQGELRWRRRRLGAAAGARVSGLSLFEIAPGARSTPPHVHADEEEICVVLRGSGLSWQDGRTYRVGAGDLLVHRCDAEAHTLIAGDDGLDALVFAEGSRTSLTYMPRTKMMWAAKRWLPADAPHPFAADAALGPLDVPAPEPCPAPAHAPATTRLDRLVLADGEQSTPVCHAAEEEIAYVLDGAGSVRIGEDEHALRPGSVAALPPGSGFAHSFSGPLEVLLFGTVVAGSASLVAGELRIRGLPT